MSRIFRKIRQALGPANTGPVPNASACSTTQGLQPTETRTQVRAIEVGNYTHYAGTMPLVEGEESPVRPLYTEAQMEQALKELRAMLAQDETPACKAALQTPFAAQLRAYGLWYQRIDYPQYGLSSTSDHASAYMDEGSFNRLAHRLTSAEACILRPWPKWFYLKPLLPALEGKSVLEIGSSNGFFSFRFAEMAARQVTGLEVVKAQCDSATWSAGLLGLKNVTFQHTDFLLDLRIQPHDVVFLSEVHNHFMFPFYGLLRLVNLARETLVIDNVADDTQEHGLTLNSGWQHGTGQMIYHSFHLTDGLLLTYLNLAGVAPSMIVRYKAPDELHHVVYVIDTRGVAQMRKKRQYPEYLRDILELKFQA